MLNCVATYGVMLLVVVAIVTVVGVMEIVDTVKWVKERRNEHKTKKA